MLNELFDALMPTLAPFYVFGTTVWNMVMALTGVTMSQTPDTFSKAAWGYVEFDIYPWMISIGETFLVTSAMIGFLRQAGDLKRDITLEALVDCGIKIVFASALMISGIDIMRQFFRMAAGMSGLVLSETPVLFGQVDMDAGALLFYMVLGFLYFLIALICSGMIFLAVYGRYLNLYLLVVSAPIAISTLPGGQGMSQTAYAWIRTFLGKTFEIVVIVLAIAISAKLCSAIDFGRLSGLAGLFDGAIQALQNVCTMVLLTAAVKGADVFMKRTFAL